MFGSVAAGGGAVGLILGGALTQYFSWRWCLYVNLVFAAIAVVGALAFIGSSRPATRPAMDWPGAVLAGAGLFLIVFGFSRAESAGWTAAADPSGLVVGVVLLGGFVAAEQRVSHPLLPLRVILDRTRAALTSPSSSPGSRSSARSCSSPTICRWLRETARWPRGCCSCR